MIYAKSSKYLRISSWWLAAVYLLLVISFTLTSVTSNASALEAPHSVNLYMFWGDGCPHCEHAKEIIAPYAKDHPSVAIQGFEVYYNSNNQAKMRAVGEKLHIDASGVPLIVVGDIPYIGFSDTIERQVISRLEFCSQNDCPDSIAEVVGVEKPSSHSPAKDSVEESGSDVFISLPFFGDVNASQASLPIITIGIGLLDGFNPCAMWALLLIITLLIGMQDRKKMWLYGGIFIATSAIVYFIFMAAWLNLFTFIGHIVAVRAVIGVAAVGIGGYYLYDWHKKRSGCTVAGSQRRKDVFTKLRSMIKEKNVWLGLAGIAMLAAAVNIVELACSAGLPVVYAGLLSGSGLADWQHYAYMAMYVFFFMLDDLIVFFIAMTTLKVVGIESKYARATRLVGGILMCILGLLLIFAPQVLLFS